MIPKWFIPVPMPTSNPPTMENCWSMCGGVTILGTPQVMIPFYKSFKGSTDNCMTTNFHNWLENSLDKLMRSWKKYIQ